MLGIEHTTNTKSFNRIVREEDIPHFDALSKEMGGGIVHPVYSTYAITRDAEWVCRLFVLDLKESHEEGIGTFIKVYHKSPAKIGETVTFEAVIDELKGTKITCSFTAQVEDRIIATGSTGQMILPKEKLQNIFQSHE